VEPNFIVIGAPKAATTSVCAILDEHPEVYLFPRKGTQFFDRWYDNGWEWYCSLFKDAGSAKAIGEGSASYSAGTSDSPVPARIARHLPGAKLIYMVRHPLKRIESHYAQQIDNGMTFSGLCEAVRTFPPLIEASRYWTRLNDFRRHFPDAQILVLFFEDFVSDQRAVMRRVYDFLGVDASFEPDAEEIRRNTRADKRTDGAVLRWLRRRRSFLRLHWATPTWLTDRLKPLLRRRIEVPIEWDDETRRWALAQVLPDVGPLLAHCGKPRDFWGPDLAADALSAVERAGLSIVASGGAS